MHNFFLEDGRDSHPGPYIGDIEFQAFLSFATNQLKWAKAHNTFRKCEYGIDLWVRGEPTQPLLLSVRNKQFMQRANVVGKLGPLHTNIIQVGKEYFQDIKEEAFSAWRQRWEVSSNTVRNREPFGYQNFQSVSSRFYKYSNMILMMGPDWIGFRYRPAIIWYPPDQYRSDSNLKVQEVTQGFAVLKQKNGFRKYILLIP